MRVETFRRSLSLAALAGAAALALGVGCSAPYKAKDGLPVCDDGDPTCNGDSNRETTRKGSSNTNNSSPSAPSTTNEPTEPEETTPTTTADAGTKADAAPPQKEPSCVKLDACCDELKQAGYDPATCKGVVSTNNNAACYSQYSQYKQFGDCS